MFGILGHDKLILPMKVPILVATPNEGFGELISQIIHDSGGYSITLVKNGADAMKQMKIHAPALCIVDAALEDIQILDLTHQIRAIEKDVFLIVIPSGDINNSDQNEDIQADGFLPVPFYNPDLLSLIEEILKKKDQKESEEELKNLEKQELEPVVPDPDLEGSPGWFEDVSLAAQYLTRLSLEASSQASIITRGKDIWAYAGELSQPAAKELAQSVEMYFVNGGGSDLARFIHLGETDRDYMLYATSLGEEFVLAMVFDSEIPFSKIRNEANKMATNLKNAPAKEYFESNIVNESQKMGNFGKKEPKNSTLPDNVGFLDELLNGEEIEVSKPDHTISEDDVTEQSKKEDESRVESVLDETQISPSAIDPDFEIKIEKKSDEKSDEVLAETVLSQVDEDRDPSPGLVLESVSPSLYNLTYACVLIPRLKEHYLTGNRASRLSEWVTQLCLAFGWRLEQLSIRPEYIQWIVNVPPSTSPGYLIRIIRQHTSRRMFSDFPRLESTNPSGDFWAPGYLIMNGNQPPPVKLISDFIQNSRTRQGV